MKKLFISIFVVFISSMLFAGPFGLEKGMSLEQVKTACGGRDPVKIDEGHYLITPLKPHPYFVKYVAWIDMKQGLNYIKAIGSDISTNGYGIELRSKFDSLEQSLSKSYGTCSRTSLLLPGSLWDDADEWMRSLEKNERYHFSTWDKKNGSTLPDDITAIALIANSTGTYSGYIVLEYEFSNHAAVSSAQKEEEDSVF